MRRFRCSETVGQVLDFVEGMESLPADRTVRVEAPFPLTEWTREMQQLTLVEMRCGNSIVLNVSLEEARLS